MVQGKTELGFLLGQFLLGALKFGDVGDDVDEAAVGRRPQGDLKRPSAAGDLPLEAYGFAFPVVGDHLFDQGVLVTGAEVAAVDLIAQLVAKRPAHLE